LQEKHGTSVLFITHDMGVVADIADRVAVMHRGRIVETGATLEVLTRPKRDYTRDLLRAVPSLTPRPVRAETSSEIALESAGLGKIYSERSLFRRTRETVAAEGVSFSLKRGRTLGVVGESGSGKSTLARCVTRLIEPTSGGIRVRGAEISGLSRAALRPHRRRIQMVFQDPYRSLNPRVTVGESIAEGPVNFGTPRKTALARAPDLHELVGLQPEAAVRYPHEFSGGQRQRIAIARAIAMEPDVLVADEAVSALDVSVQAQVLSLFAELQDRLGIAILFITHDLRVAAQICDDVAVMQNGRIVEYGPAETVLRQPSQTYTRDLLEAAPGRHWDFANFRPLITEKIP
jgi:peptide/nickel transport system ATP-binding protein